MTKIEVEIETERLMLRGRRIMGGAVGMVRIGLVVWVGGGEFVGGNLGI